MLTEEAIKAYADLIQLRRSQVPIKTKPGEVEIHHVLPTSCGGLDVPENKIALYAKEHFMAHVYLWIIHHEDEFHCQTMCALNMMVKGTLDGSRKELRDFILTSEEYQKAREEYAQFISETIGKKISGEKNGAYGKHWYKDPNSRDCAMFFDGQQPDGWITGRYQTKPDTFVTHLKGKIKVVRKDHSEIMFVFPDDAENMIATGEWERKTKPKSVAKPKSFRRKSNPKRRTNFLDEVMKLEAKGTFDCQDNTFYRGVVKRIQVRRYLEATGHHCCAKCGKSGIQLIVHAKDGNCRNLQLDNYEFLCRDCYLNSGTAGFSGRHRKKKT